MRGKDNLEPPEFICIRITPAYAGKSWYAVLLIFSDQDHPRVCGEKVHGE